MKTKIINNDPAGILVKKAMNLTVQMLRSLGLPPCGVFFMEAAMKDLCLIRNKGTEKCRELLGQDPVRLSYEQRKAKEDAEKFRQIVADNRKRLGLEVSRA